MCMVTIGHIITIKIFPEGWGSREGKGTGAPAPPVPFSSGAAHAQYCSKSPAKVVTHDVIRGRRSRPDTVRDNKQWTN